MTVELENTVATVVDEDGGFAEGAVYGAVFELFEEQDLCILL